MRGETEEIFTTRTTKRLGVEWLEQGVQWVGLLDFCMGETVMHIDSVAIPRGFFLGNCWERWLWENQEYPRSPEVLLLY
jgi:hypothetical protein